ncbi:MAG: mandelate racemase/muconate lactonizing enzyme family protein [Pseudomonadota bacterium]
MKILSVETRPCRPAFFGDGYKMSFVMQRALDHRYVRLVTEGGTGTGEISRDPTWAGAAQDAMEDAVLDALPGTDLADLPAQLAAWRADKRLTGAAFGVELAMLDLLSQRSGVPVSSLLGGPGSGQAPECLSLGCVAPEALAQTIRTRGRDYPVIQAKLAGDDLEQDLARVDAALAVLGPHQELLADFNGALTPDQAIPVIRSREHPQLIWEEPCNRFEDNVIVAHASRPLMLDQCLTTPEHFARAVMEGVASALVIKSDAVGGLSVGRGLAQMCEAAGIRYRIDGWWCGPVAAAGVLNLAIGAGPGLISVMELTDPIDSDKRHFQRRIPGHVGPAGGPGLGPVTQVWDSVAPVPA